MEPLLAVGLPERGEIAVRFALAKECDDLGEHARGFRHLKAGADIQRRRLRYDIRGNVAVMDRVIRAHTMEALSGVETRIDPGSRTSDNPIFVIGLPRSGTTLVERIIAGHAGVVAAGELGTLPNELIRLARLGGVTREGEWVERLDAIDFGALGRAYSRVAREMGIPPESRYTDKYPPNFLFCGVIRLAFPNARIVALRRSPMDACFALYKTLFNKGIYPYSYDLGEVAVYYAAFRRLMGHWRETLPDDFFMEVSYEDVVADLEGQSRRILGFLGLPWEDGVLRFHESDAPATTASAVQVRQPIYASSIGKWRNYAEQLEPLRARLAELLPGEDLG
jgi:hypothetical protein